MDEKRRRFIANSKQTQTELVETVLIHRGISDFDVYYIDEREGKDLCIEKEIPEDLREGPLSDITKKVYDLVVEEAYNAVSRAEIGSIEKIETYRKGKVLGYLEGYADCTGLSEEQFLDLNAKIEHVSSLEFGGNRKRIVLESLGEIYDKVVLESLNRHERILKECVRYIDKTLAYNHMDWDAEPMKREDVLREHMGL